MSEVVYSFAREGVFSLKVTGRNGGRYEAYCGRLGVEPGSEESSVEEMTPDGPRRGAPAFFETRYFVRCDFKDRSVRDAFVNHKMASVASAFDFDGGTLVGTLDFVNAPGKFRFEIVWYRNGKRESAAFEWMVVSEKLDVKRDYAEIVRTIEANAPGLVRAFLAKSRGGAGVIPRSATEDEVWADIFGEIAERYRRACEWVANRPHLKYVSEVEFRRAGRVKRWTPELANRWAAMAPGERAAAFFRTEHVSPQVDTVENRFVKFTLESIVRRLGRFADECEKHKTVNERFVQDMRGKGRALAKVARQPFFAGVGRFTGLRQESMVLQRKQGYAEIYAAWITLQKSLDTTQAGFSTGHRPISALYEFWCFLRIAGLLEKDFGLGQPKGRLEGARVYGDLFEEPDPERMGPATLSSLSYAFEEKDGMAARLLYQPNYGEMGEGGDLALYNPQRPDIVLVIERGGETFTYLFDAKYRIEPRGELDASPAESINDMHRYRDAILYRSQEGERRLSRQIVGAYVLYPGRPLPRSYDYAGLIREENIGAIPLLPGEEGGAALKAFLGEILAKRTPEDHLGTDIPTRGTTVLVARDEHEYLKNEVVYGLYRHLGWIKENLLYNLPLDAAAAIGIADEAGARARRMLYLLPPRGGRAPMTFRLVPDSARLVTRKWLVDNKGYPKDPTGDDSKQYWLWELLPPE